MVKRAYPQGEEVSKRIGANIKPQLNRDKSSFFARPAFSLTNLCGYLKKRIGPEFVDTKAGNSD